MLSSEVYQMLEIIAREPKRNAKISLMREFFEDEDFKKIVEQAYNPFIKFGIIKVNIPTSVHDGDFDDDTFELLSDLADRSLTGNVAHGAIIAHLMYLGEESQRLLGRILNKDLEIGMNVKSINKAAPGLIPQFPYMRCSLPKHVDLAGFPWETGVVSQEKADGLYMDASLTGDSVFFTTRKGLGIDSSKFPGIVEDLVKFMGTTETRYNGEIVVFRDGVRLPRKQSNGVINRVREGGNFAENEEPIYFVWDLMPLNYAYAGCVYSVPYATRYNTLVARVGGLKSVRLIETRMVYSFEAAVEHAEEMWALGKEGTVFKDPKAVWKDGTSLRQIKIKAEKECELKVVGFNPGTGKNASTFGSLACESRDGSVKASASGFTDKEREEINNERGGWLGAIVTVKFNEVITKEGVEGYSLFIPGFVERRFDKSYADSTDYILSL